VTATITAEPPREIEDGVIEEARRRQRRRHGLGAALGALAATAIAAALLIGGGGSSNSRAPGVSEPGRPLKLTLLHGRAFSGNQQALMGVTWSLQAGNVGVCVRVISSGDCNGPPPTAGYPVYGGGGGYSPEEKVGPAGEIDAIFTGRGVAAMRVAHLGTFKATSAPGLPPGAKQIVFYRPPGSPGTVLPPGTSPKVLQGFEHAKQGPALTETLLDSHGHGIRVREPGTFTLPNSYWQGAQRMPAAGRCAMSSSLAGVRTEWGQVATVLAGDQHITTPAWLSCLHVWFSRGGASYETAILLNGMSPGSTPPRLWGAIPVPGRPGIVEIPPIQREFHMPALSAAQATRILTEDTKTVGRTRAERILRESQRRTFVDQFVPPGVARRVGPAWILVNGGGSLTKRIGFLDSLHITKLELTR
jgi:hypothetical protein